jgi:hypothetical protein
MAPHGGKFICLADGKGPCIPTNGRDSVNIPLIIEEDGLSVGRNGRVTKPQRFVLAYTCNGNHDAQEKGDEIFHFLFWID